MTCWVDSVSYPGSRLDRQSVTMLTVQALRLDDPAVRLAAERVDTAVEARAGVRTVRAALRELSWALHVASGGERPDLL